MERRRRTAGYGSGGGIGERAPRRLGDAADRCRGARASCKRADACLLRNNPHLPCGCRIPGCVQPEVHVSARWRTHGACRRRGFVPETSAGDLVSTPSLPLCEIGDAVGAWHRFRANSGLTGGYSEIRRLVGTFWFAKSRFVLIWNDLSTTNNCFLLFSSS